MMTRSTTRAEKSIGPVLLMVTLVVLAGYGFGLLGTADTAPGDTRIPSPLPVPVHTTSTPDRDRPGHGNG
jgi:hypothetical protein